MSPKLLHQSFETDSRLEITFLDEELPHAYMASYDGAYWLDTELLPPGTDIERALTAVHYSMLKPDLSRLGISLDDAYAFSPTTRSLGFTLRVTCHISEGKQPTAEVRYSKCRRQLSLPDISSITSADRVRAEAAMGFWRLENGHIQFT